MSSRRTRERQLAKLAQRRAAERRRKARRRAIALTVGGLVAAGAVAFAGFTFLGGTGKEAASTPTPTPTGSVACGATAPAAGTETKPNFKKPPAMSIDTTKRYSATVRTSCGTFRIELFPKDAPVTVNNFVFLARKGFYDGLTFHRIAKAPAVVQGGDPFGTGSGGPGYQFKDELNNGRTYELGTVAMANSGPDTNGSQFFVVVGESGTQLPNDYTIFGRVTQGMDVVQRIHSLPVQPGTEVPAQKVYMEKVTIRES